MSARALCNTTAKTRTAVPVRTPRVAIETAKLSAWEVYARGDQGRSAGPDLRRGAPRTDRERGRCCAGAKEDEREWE